MLVQAAKDAVANTEQEEDMLPWNKGGPKNAVAQMRAEMEFQAEILKREKELQEARKRLFRLRNENYGKNVKNWDPLLFSVISFRIVVTASFSMST